MDKASKRASLSKWKSMEVLVQSGGAALLGKMLLPDVEHVWVVAGALAALLLALEHEARKGTIRRPGGDAKNGAAQV